MEAVDEFDRKSRQNEELDEKKTIVSAALGLMTAGYDTTSQLLSLTSYYLAKHPGNCI